jgi:CheY-like chemotaxis protein
MKRNGYHFDVIAKAELPLEARAAESHTQEGMCRTSLRVRGKQHSRLTCTSALAEQPSRAREREDSARESSGELPLRGRVLVVDDEPVIADSLVAILEHDGYEGRAAYDAATGLQCCESFLPDLVISDVVMPGMSGVEMSVIIRQRYPNCKVLLFSGQANTESFLEGARKQGYHFEMLAKPVHPRELLRRIAEYVPPAADASSHLDSLTA